MRPSTQLKAGQPLAQRHLPLLAERVRPSRIEDELLASADTLLEAIHLCVHLSKLPHWKLAEILGIDRGHWTRIMQGKAHFPTNRVLTLMEVCGNYAPLQWMAKNSGFELFEDAKAKRREELERELKALEAAA